MECQLAHARETFNKNASDWLQPPLRNVAGRFLALFARLWPVVLAFLQG